MNNELLAGYDLWLKLVGDDDFPYPGLVATTPTAAKVMGALKLPHLVRALQMFWCILRLK